MSLVLVWDLDDTLIKTGYKYEKFIEEFVKEFFDGDINYHIQNIKSLDGERVLEFGFKPNRLIESMLMYAYHCDVYSLELENWLRTYHNAFIKYGSYDLIMDSYNTLKDTLNTFSGVFNVILTSGVEEIQRKKIISTGINDYIDGYKCIDHFKTTKDFKDYKKEFLQEFDINDSTLFISIGNSLKSDIYPAIEAGYLGIYIETNNGAHFYNMDKSYESYKQFYSTVSKITIDDIIGLVDYWEL